MTPGAPPAIGASAPADLPREPPERDAGRVAGNISGDFPQAVSPGPDSNLRTSTGFGETDGRNISPEGFRAAADLEAPRTTTEPGRTMEQLLRDLDAAGVTVAQLGRAIREAEPDPSGVLALAAREGFTVEGQ